MATPNADSPANSHFETGSLTQRALQQSDFIGSSSGVHFVRLVRASCEGAAPLGDNTGRELPLPEDIVGVDRDEREASTARYDRVRGHPTSQPLPQEETSIPLDAFETLSDNSVLPSLVEAQALAVKYFQSWHPLLPFIYGPTFMPDIERLYYDTRQPNQPASNLDQTRIRSQRFLLRCLFATVAPDQSSITPSTTLIIAGQLASRYDLLTLQAVLMAQLRCVSAMALRVASSLSGLLSRLLLHAGLHRCPYRYQHLDGVSRDLRKRIFWSAYILDRYISQALGLPPTIADSDVDVCAPGCPELHDPERRGSTDISSQSPQSRNHTKPGSAAESLGFSPSRAAPNDSPSPDKQEFLLAHLVKHGQLVSRVLDIFHKSIHVRSIESERVLSIRADTNRWFNSLPQWPLHPGQPVLDQLDKPIRTEQISFIPFLHILYQQLLIAIHRPYLSLPTSSPEFENSLQLSVRAARQTNNLLSDVSDFFWPGYVASAWMSGLILIFACQARAFSTNQGLREIDKCLEILRRMQSQWDGAGRCHTALSALIGRFDKRPDFSGEEGSSARSRNLQVDGDGRYFTQGPEHPCTSSGAAVDVGNEMARDSWMSGGLVVGGDNPPDFGLGTGAVFQNVSWDGDFSSLDYFTAEGMYQ